MVNWDSTSTIRNSFTTKETLYDKFPSNEDERGLYLLLEEPNLVHIQGVLDSSANSMIGDGIIHYFGNNPYPSTLFQNLTSITAHMTGFDFLGEKRYTLLRILDIEDARQSLSFRQKEVLVVPAVRDTFDGEEREPVYGYYYDAVNGVIDTMTYQDMDELQEQTRFWVWCVDYDPVGDIFSGSGNDYWACTGENAPLPNDGFCDILCGEDSINSPQDCRGFEKRHLKISWVEILGDRKNKGTGKYDYMESYLGGAYEIGCVFLIKKAVDKVYTRGAHIDYKWHKVIRTKYKNGNYKRTNNGVVTRLWDPNLYARVDPYDLYRVAKQSLLDPIGSPIKDNVLDPAFNPMRDTIYCIWYEHDNGRSGSRGYTHKLDVPGTFFNTFSGVLAGDKRNEQAAGPKKWLSNTGLGEPTGSGGDFRHFIKIVPSDWSNRGLPSLQGTYDLVRTLGHNSNDEYFVSFGLKFE